MRKIDKSLVLSKNYREWLETLENEHPKYSSSNTHYKDVRMSLLHCQKGLCAYTEELLCDPSLITLENWDAEKYITNIPKSVRGDLEHFDPSLKEKQGWLWDNLFIVDTHTNCRIKGSKPIKSILKPDSPTYDEHKYLQFDYENNVFIPNITLLLNEREEVAYMIDILGLNCVDFKRERQLQTLRDRLAVGLDEGEEPKEYITSWKMTLEALKKP